jgi:DNA-directed RNA polymerase subunit alpha
METMGIATIGELVSKSEAELAGARNFGRVSLTEIKKKLLEMGLSFKDSE